MSTTLDQTAKEIIHDYLHGKEGVIRVHITKSGDVTAHNDTTSNDELTEDEEEKALEWLRDNVQVIVFDGGVIISN